MDTQEKDKHRKNTTDDALDDDYVSLDITSATECTGMVPAPPLSEAEVEGYSDMYSVPQKRASQVDEDGKKKQRKK